MSVGASHVASHNDLSDGDTVIVEVVGVRHNNTQLELSRVDGNGSFYVDLNCGPDFYDHSFGRRLTSGARFEAVAIPASSSGRDITVSILPDLSRHLRQAPGSVRLPYRGRRTPLVPARIIKGPSSNGYVTIELDHRDDDRGVIYRFGFKASALPDNMEAAAGTPLLAVLQPDRNHRRWQLEGSQALIEVVARHADDLEAHGASRRVRPRRTSLPRAVIDDLLRLDPSPGWRRRIWRFYEHSLRLTLDDVRPSSTTTAVKLADEVIPLAGEWREAIGSRHDVDIELDEPAGTVLISGDDGSAVAAARAELDALNALPVVAIAITPEGAARIAGEGADTVEKLRKSEEVVAIEISDSVVTVIGNSGFVAMNAVRELYELTLPSKGHMDVPAGKSEFIFGEDNATIKRICGATGCRADEIEPGRWSIEGPNPQSVEKFIELATAVVYGTTGAVDRAGVLHRVVDRTTPSVIEATGTEVPQRDHTTSVAERLVESVTTQTPFGEPSLEPALPETEASDAEASERHAPPPRRVGSPVPHRPVASQEPAAPTGPRRRDMNQPLANSPRSHRWTRRIAAITGVAAVVVAAALVLPRPSEQAEGTGPIGAISTSDSSSTPEQSVVGPESMSFAIGNSAAGAQACWLSVMATWSEVTAARQGVERLQGVGLPATVLASDLVPGWGGGRHVAAVATRGETTGRTAVERARTAGFDGSLVQAEPGACEGVYTVPPGSPVWLEDVAPDDTSHTAIRWALDEGALTTCVAGPNRFCPEDVVTRGELASVLATTFGLEASGTTTLSDVSSAGPGAQAAIEAGLMTACGEGADRFCPEEPASRGETALALATALGIGTPAPAHFTDTAGSSHRNAADGLYEIGVVDECGPDAFCPEAAITRATLAVWLYAAFGSAEA